MYLAGTILLVTAVAMALLAVGSYGLVIRGNRPALTYGRFGVFGTLVAMVMAWSLLIMLFMGRRFEFEYVNNYSSADLDFFFTLAASWAGQPGSFLIWVLWGCIASAFLVKRTRHFEPYVLIIMMLVQAALLIFVVMLNPFKPLFDATTGQPMVPTDGKGLNPLLHNFWMIIHPPILFVGYALTTVPFAFAVAALLRHDYDTWIQRALPWTLGAWCFLGLALLLGGYWAYETLGWGGYWGWDPVENSSLVPWILLTALLHGMVLQRSHGGFRRSNLLLALLAYCMVFYATFLTRSGVYANFSVHSFVAEGIYEGLVIFLSLLFLGSLVLFAMRWRDIPARPLSDKFLSRDSFFVLSTITFVVLALVIGLGTSMPVISAIPGVGHTLQGWMGGAFELDDGTLMNPQAQPFEDGRFSMAPSFYQRTTPPLGIVVVALLILGPLLGWRDSNMRHLLRALRWPAVAAVLAAIVAMLINVRDVLSLAYVSLGVFAVGTNLVMIVRTLRSGWLRIGGYLAHVGFVIMLIGVVGSSAYAKPEERLTFSPGDTVGIYGYNFTFNGWTETPDGKGVLDLTVNDGSRSYSAKPYLYFNQRMGATTQTPSIHSYGWQDLYISPAGYDPEVNPARPIMGVNDTRTMGPYELTFLGFDMDREAMMSGGEIKVGATIQVAYEGQISQVTPRVQVVVDPQTNQQKLEYVAATLPGGQTLNLVELDPNQRMILLEGKGEGIDGLPAIPAKAVITVSTKPLVVLVWVGVGIGVLGGFIALIRRYLEGSALLAGQRIALPKGIAGLFGR
jgi:cytochrome c-type biogenesis protein CcmF